MSSSMYSSALGVEFAVPVRRVEAVDHRVEHLHGGIDYAVDVITYQHNSFPMINIKVSTSRFWIFSPFFTAPIFCRSKKISFSSHGEFFSNVYSSSLNPINFIPPYFSANMHTIFKLDSPFV